LIVACWGERLPTTCLGAACGSYTKPSAPTKQQSEQREDQSSNIGTFSSWTDSSEPVRDIQETPCVKEEKRAWQGKQKCANVEGGNSLKIRGTHLITSDE